MGLMMCEGKFVSRDEIALVQTPPATESWKPVPHMEVIEAVTDVVKAHNWQILDENFGLAAEILNNSFAISFLIKLPLRYPFCKMTAKILKKNVAFSCKIIFAELYYFL